VLKGEGIHHCNDEQDQHDLDENVEADAKPANFLL